MPKPRGSARKVMNMEKNAVLDCSGLSCPMPIVELAKKMNELQQGGILEMIASDVVAKEDVPAWCKRTGNQLLGADEKNNLLRFYIKKS